MKKLYAGALLGALLISMNAFGAVNNDRFVTIEAEEPNIMFPVSKVADPRAYSNNLYIGGVNPELVELLNASKERRLTAEESKRLRVLQGISDGRDLRISPEDMDSGMWFGNEAFLQ